MSIDLLIEKIKKCGNPSVVGLDPDFSYIPSFLKEKAFAEHGVNEIGATQAILEFNFALIDALSDVVPAVKPQSAYYEMYGIEGIKALYATIDYAKSKGMYVIADVKRNDIGTTAMAYAKAYIGQTELTDEISIKAFDAHSATVNPYLGTDGIKPFVEMCKDYQKSIFVLIKTSNPSSGEIQDLDTAEGKVFERVATLVDQWGKMSMGETYSNIGAVVGATYPHEAISLRKMLPTTYFLVPGYGAQGGTAKDVANSFNDDGLGAIVNSSRGIMCAYKKDGINEQDFAKSARNEAVRMRDEIVSYIR